ncbi:DMT family transporter [Jannaschia aquimarina]|uniref:EamA-like transporter family protein n=1 Tax=Jannaschia aquimarina TaxID=935700 RepID=A0A0D1EJD3_9RHOB|nr:DMT family transporter [Jannaschia aquimarina]KIT17714.1 EamA-like transporter family protein [Jannaschia aquimarina]SNS78343.1 EamA-like transporter family protein [Jannaschia aquimarina]
MTDWIAGIEGTEAGHVVALWLALLAAFLHALFGALQKGAVPPYAARTAIDAGLVAISAPVALFLVPWPQGTQWLLLLGAVAIHFVYKVLQAETYRRGAYTVVYPVVRGTGPLFTVLGASIVFGETFTAIQWAGVGVLLAGLFGLSIYNARNVDATARRLLPSALGLAVLTGLMVAVYTTWDAYGIRATPNPFTFLFWFFFLTALDFPLIAAARRALRPSPHLVRLGLTGAVIAWGSFGAVMMATRLDSVGEAAVLRETSTVFAAVIGWVWLKESVGPRRLLLMALIALGAVIVEMGG